MAEPTPNPTKTTEPTPPTPPTPPEPPAPNNGDNQKGSGKCAGRPECPGSKGIRNID